jgi:diacylglycerol O-acyltransferase / wax synthase
MRTTTRVLQRVGQRFVTTVTTNVPGPQIPLYLLGRRMVAAYPYVPIGEALRIGVAIFSYDGALTFGVTGDYDTTEDLDVLADGIAAGFDELTDAARHAEPEPVTS